MSKAQIIVAGNAPDYIHHLARSAEQYIANEKRGPYVLTVYAKALLPDATKFRGGQIQVSDDVGGETPAFSDGVSWRRYADRAIIS